MHVYCIQQRQYLLGKCALGYRGRLITVRLISTAYQRTDVEVTVSPAMILHPKVQCAYRSVNIRIVYVISIVYTAVDAPQKHLPAGPHQVMLLGIPTVLVRQAQTRHASAATTRFLRRR